MTSPDTEAPSERTMVLLKRLWRDHLRPYRAALAVAVVAMVVVAATQGVLAWLMDPVVNKVFVAKDTGVLWALAGGIFATFLIRSAAAYVQEIKVAWVGQRVIANLRERLYRSLLAQDLAFFHRHPSGTLVSRITNDIQSMQQIVSLALVGAGRDVLSVLVLVGVMVYQDWLLSLLVLVVGPAASWPLQRLSRFMRRVTREGQAALGHLTARLTETLQGMRLVKGYGLEEILVRRTHAAFEALLELRMHMARARALTQPLIDGLGGMAITAVILYGGSRVIGGETTPGAFFSFLTAAMMAYQPLRGLAKVNAFIQEGLAAAERVFELMDQPPTLVDPPRPAPLPAGPGPVAFEGVHFHYADGTPALDTVTFTAPAGATTALVGPSGAGKSTVLNLIPRFFDPTGGHVRVHGVDVRDLAQTDLRQAMALVSQEAQVFDDSILENIRYGRPEASFPEVAAAAEAAAALPFIEALPDGWETRCGELGQHLSGGQRQRVAIARAILKDAPFLLLDEATSALDSESERQIQAALARLRQGRTTLVIAHRLSTVMDADHIVVLDQGRVAEQGSHADLVASGGLYARLHSLQFPDDPEARG